MRKPILIVFLLVLASPLPAATIHVPDDYATIQAAVDAAQPGDEVVVSPGTYVQSAPLEILNPITVRSTFDGTDWSVVESTIIKAEGNLTVVSLRTDGVTLRGFTVTRDPIANPLPGTGAGGVAGSGTNSNVEYCIVENHVHTPSPGIPGSGSGAAIFGVNGVIQNNIIRNNRADGGGNALLSCHGTIRNNVIYNNVGGSHIVNCNILVNNTVYDTSGGASSGGIIINNIFWATEAPSFILGFLNKRPPRNCVVKGYTGAGENIITDDPKFVDPENGDFQLQADSPAIDAGLTTTTTEGVTADFKGVQRGLKAVLEERGDGSAVDIGAYEFLPEPLAIWIPGGEPDPPVIAGDPLTVAWRMIPVLGGESVILRLQIDSALYEDYGDFFSAGGEGQTELTLPPTLFTSDRYIVHGSDPTSPTLYSTTAPFTILGVSGVRKWEGYE